MPKPLFDLDLSSPKIMGILNVTPDSFSDGGRFVVGDSLESASLDGVTYRAKLEQEVTQMIQDGAHIIDVGGESTRPGAKPVSPQQELDRVMPALEVLSEFNDVVVSVDTSSPQLMRESLKYGVGLINDVRALQREGALQAAAQSQLPVCLMHMQGMPETMQDKPGYSDVIAEVKVFLDERVQAAVAAGVSRDSILLDPGFGFGKKLEHNLLLLKHLNESRIANMPLLVGLSRKSMIEHIYQARGLVKPVSDRLIESVALALIAMQNGANILRVHDVRQTAEALRIFEAYASVK